MTENIREKLHNFSEQSIAETDVEGICEIFRKTVQQIGDDILGKRELVPRNLWITQEILYLMDERRVYKNWNDEIYKGIQKKVTRKAKEN